LKHSSKPARGFAQANFYAKENGVGPVLRREYDLAVARIRGKPIEPTKGMRNAFPAPAAFWVGLRPYIYAAPLTMLVPPIYLISCLSGAPLYFALSVIASLSISGYRLAQSDYENVKNRANSAYTMAPNPIQKLFLLVFLPFWAAATFAGLFSATTASRPFVSVLLFSAFLFFKNGICMSVILHRYCAHAAFKCHWTTSLVLGVVACFGYQGGPIWWASRHRAHHKFCDTTQRDPHSPALIGVVNAFSFFLSGRTPDDMRSVQSVDEEFTPSHIDTPAMRVIDSLSFVMPLVEFYAALSWFGPAGLWVSFSSSWVGQVSTLWFNVRNHPIGGAEEKRKGPPPEHHSHRRTCITNVNCDAIDAPTTVDTWPLYIFLDFIASFISPAVGEDDHDHHHSHPALAVRPGFDAPHYFVSAMAAVGLVWNVQREGMPRVNSSRISLASLWPGSRSGSEVSLADKAE